MLPGKQIWTGPAFLPTGAGSVQPGSRNEPTRQQSCPWEKCPGKDARPEHRNKHTCAGKGRVWGDQGSERNCESLTQERSHSCHGEHGLGAAEAVTHWRKLKLGGNRYYLNPPELSEDTEELAVGQPWCAGMCPGHQGSQLILET